jgi:hypothetical protein
MYNISTRIIVMLIAGAALIGVILFGLEQCRERQNADKQAEVSKEQGQASIAAGTSAMNTVSNVNSNDAATDATVSEGQASVRNAPEGQKGKAAIAAACRLKAYRDDPQCKGIAK